MNNVSLGLYAQLVHERESHRRRRDAFAQLRALLLLAENPRGMQLSVDGRDVDAHVALVANNAYKLELFSLVERERLDAGCLFLYFAHSWRPREWEERSCERVTIDAGGHQIDAAIDGEPTSLKTPLDFSIEPRALRVLVPAPG
jgi:diacylglycerol kinase family enzyme